MRVETVVNTLLKFANDNSHEITHLKLQKLLYFLHGEYLAKTERLLIDEQFEAWQYGPVVPKVYEQYKSFGGKPIGTTYYPSIDIETKTEKFFVVGKNNNDFWEVLEKTWKKYGHLSGTQLSTLSHETGSPWSQTKILKSIISNDLIKDYFVEKNKTEVIYE